MIFAEKSGCLILAANVAGLSVRPAPHYSTESGEDLSTSCNTNGSANALAFWMAINEKFDGWERIDSRIRHALGSWFSIEVRKS
jgi:hypothetical protein